MTLSPPPARRVAVLITGASSGIGAELAKCFARDGSHLVLVARSEPALRALADELQRQHGAPSTILVHDLAQPDAPDALVAELARLGLTIDVLVNNAGFGTYGPFVTSSWASQRDMMQVNLVALAHLTRLMAESMVARGRGKILNVASTAAFQPGPLMAVYYATKAFVVSLSEALANELEGTGVSVTVLCPGPTRTQFQQRARLERTRLVRRGLMDAPTVARVGYRALQQGRIVVIPGARNRLLVWLVRLAPRRMVTRVVRWIQSRR